MDGIKSSKKALGAEVISRFNDFAPPTLLAQASRINFSTRLFNLIVTNVPGPQIPLYVLGRELLDIFPVAFLPENHALAIAIMSYNGKIDFGLLGDYDAMEDVDADRRGHRGRGQAAARSRRGPAERTEQRRRKQEDRRRQGAGSTRQRRRQHDVSDPGPSPFKYHLELTPAQLQAHPHRAALAARSTSATTSGRRGVIREVLDKLPDEHAIRPIRLSDDGGSCRSRTTSDDGPPPPDLPA